MINEGNPKDLPLDALYTADVTFCFCYHKETLWTEVDQGGQCFQRDEVQPCHPLKNVIFISLYQISLFPTQFQYYLIKNSLRISRHSKWMSQVAMTLLRKPWQPPLVSLFELYPYIFHTFDIYNECHPLYISFTKTLWHSKLLPAQLTNQITRNFIWGIIINI